MAHLGLVAAVEEGGCEGGDSGPVGEILAQAAEGFEPTAVEGLAGFHFHQVDAGTIFEDQIHFPARDFTEVARLTN